MDFYIKILLISFATTIIVGTFILLIVLKARKVNIENKEESKLKNTSSMSGIMIIISIIISIVICYFCSFINNKDFIVKLYPLIFIIIIYGIIGLFYDFSKTSLVKKRFIIKILILSATLIGFIIHILNNVHLGTKTLIPFSKVYVELPLWIYIPFTISISLLIIKSVQLTNKIDGLTSIISTIIITLLTIIGIILNVEEIVVSGIIIIGVGLGFLLFNLKPSKIAIGDASTLLLGGTIATQVLYLRIPLVLLMIAIIPILRIITVIVHSLHFNIKSKKTSKEVLLYEKNMYEWGKYKTILIFSISTLISCFIALISIVE